MVLGFSALASAQCSANSTFIQASCVRGCYSLYTMTGILENDVILRRPTQAQSKAIRNDLNQRWATLPGRASIDQPGVI